MTQSIIVFGPPGCGKTRNARRIANHFGLTKIVDEINPSIPPEPEGVLYLTNVTMRSGGVCRVIPYVQVMQEIDHGTANRPRETDRRTGAL